MNGEEKNLLGLSGDELTAYFASIGEKPFRAKQLMRWIHRAGVSDFSEMSDLAKSLRAKLSGTCEVRGPSVAAEFDSADGTRKWLVNVGGGNAVETVFIPEDSRATLCVSTQAGCAVNCLFCATGKQGFSKNLTASEIIGQLWLAEFAMRKALNTDERVISNVVLMGMGEPLLNFDATVSALKLMLDDNAYGLSRRRVTVSTTGIVPMIDKLKEACPVSLAVSLHAPDNELRNRLVPINRRYPLEEVMGALRRYLEDAPRDFITFEYCLLGGVNDSVEHAKKTVELVTRGKTAVPCKFNLIAYNPIGQGELKRPDEAAVKRFASVLIDAGIVTTVRRTRGADIEAACGLLAGDINDKTGRAKREEQTVRFNGIC